MRKLDVYVFRELLVPFLIGTIAVVLMFQANVVIALLKSYPSAATPTAAILKYIVYRTPGFLQMTLPVGIALASSLAVSRFTRESELAAMRSAGASILRVLRPVAFFGLVVGLLNFYIAERVMPSAEREGNRLLMSAGLAATAPDFKSNVVLNLSRFTVYIGTVQKQGEVILLDDVLAFERPAAGEKILYSAKAGTYDKGVWTFADMVVWYFKDDMLIEVKPDEDVVFNEKIEIQDMFTPPVVTEQTIAELQEGIKHGRTLGRNVVPLQVSLHTRYSVPASCFVFALAAPVFAIWLGRSGGFVGVLLSILLVFLYYNIFVISTDIFGKNGWLPPAAAAWLPNALFAVFAIVGLRRLE